MSRINTKGKQVYDQDVYLDGHNWEFCYFKNCNIIISEGNFSVNSCDFERCKLTARGRASAILKIAQLFEPRIRLIT